MLRFENPNILFGLFLIPVFILLFMLFLRWKKKSMEKFGELDVISQLMPWISKGRVVLKFILLMFALFFLIIGMANPQVGSKLVKAQRKGIDLMIALDVSNSMLAQDIKPNRLEKSKQAISKLIEKLSSDRIGIIVFAGKAYIQLPITSDYSAAKLFLSTINTDIVSVQGTAIGDAVSLAVNSFDDNNHDKAIIVITDGENHEGDAVQEAKFAAEKGIHVYTIGMGLPEGAPIPLYRGNSQIGYKKDNQNNTIITQLDEVMLKQIASVGDGIYVRANNTKAGLKKVFEAINKLEKKEYDSIMFADYEDRFQYFIALAIILLLIEFFIAERKSRILSSFKLFEK
jgi:Ca-activated chloride channel family protein